MAGLRADVSLGYSQHFYPSAVYGNHQLSVPYHLQQTPTDLSCHHHVHKNVHRHYNSSDSELETEEEEFDFEDDEVDDDDYDEEDLAETTPSRLLDFVNVVTNDIRSKFERNKGSDDFCDVYEDRFGTTLSGRELYYADLLELANSNYGRGGGGGRQKNTTKNARSSDSSPSNRSAVCSPNPTGVAYIYDASTTEGDAVVQQMCLSGRCVSDYGLGPLEELFKKKRNAANDKSNYTLATSPIPMTMRKLPNSFWQEPGIHSKDHIDSVDFTDLFTQWNNDKC